MPSTEQKVTERAYRINISNFTYNIVDLKEIPYSVRSCELPIINVNKTSCIAGLCAILRQIIKATAAEEPKHYCRKLLGFKDSCLMACSESSVWTKFCEVDLILSLKSLDHDGPIGTVLPSSIARFECHMSHPVRLHNLYKYSTSKKVVPEPILLGKSRLPEHVYAEGAYITLADIIIFVCVHILLGVFSATHSTTRLLPLTTKWYERMIDDQLIRKCLDCLPLMNRSNLTLPNYTLPDVANESLYKRDPRRYKPRSRIYTRQEDIVEALEFVIDLNIDMRVEVNPFLGSVEIHRETIPYDATPEGGSLPPARLNRKREQLENMCKPVMKIARAGDVIVDFCSGSGHLGILIAHLLPQCSIILLENKEESLNRAKERVKRLQLTNVMFYQCNLDYFKGDFDIGVSLHACGVATDLVIQQCINRNAVFVCCPCCYGSVHDCHHLTYPRSDFFKRRMDRPKYANLSHAADQTHDEGNAKTKQGYQCMAIVDTDRKLHAEQFDYEVCLAKFIPENCTPKNHILVGIPKVRNAIEKRREYS